MKLFTALLLLNLSFLGFSQEIKVEITGNIFNVESDSIFISQFFGDRYEDHAAAKFKKDGSFKFKTTLPRADYYVLRFDNSRLNLILRDSANLKIYGDGKNIGQFANIMGSEESTRMNEYLRMDNAWKARVDSAQQAIQADPSVQAELNQKLQTAFYQHQGSIQAYIAQNANSPALIPVLGVIDINKDLATYESIVAQLMIGFSESPTVQNLNNELIQMKKDRYANDPLAPGKPAPDFTEVMPSGDSLSLSDLRGQVVLLDFWASWCGPCRKENPAVVEMYKKYNAEGFTVMSVSLDKVKESWLGAIEKDQLIWPNHVSDLKHWSSRVAKMYGVSGIPFTVLIDREGNIVQTKLRGAQLEAELVRIFGH